MKYDHTCLLLPITDAQKTKATEPARLSVSRQAILNAIIAIDNIKGTDIQTTSLMHVARQLRIMRDGLLQAEQGEQLAADVGFGVNIPDENRTAEEAPTPEAAADAEIEAADQDREDAKRTLSYMDGRDARQAERRKKHPILAKIIDRVNRTQTDIDADAVREHCPVIAETLDNRPRTLADVEESRPLPKITHHFTLEQIREASDEMAGFCIACGSYHETCEPDAQNYCCEECGELQVFGADELVQMGLVD